MVIASSGWVQNASDSHQEENMSATGILICHDNSYPFQERTLSLEHPIKIGRSVARARAANDNAIFDCKVLSRNHALLWYESGKFYLKDTKSSNGTFVNNKRLSPSGEESIACEVCSGDVVQFGVDVVESTKKVTHGCIVATLKLYLPDGKEAKALFSNSVTYVNVTLEDLYKLNQFIQEAGRRENALRSKLEYMQQLLEHTRIATNQSWKALVLEDCLLSRLEMLENQVLIFSKNCGEDKLKIELVNLLEDKAQYQNATKELLQKKIHEKREIINKVQILKSRLTETEEETQNLHSVIEDNQNELQELAIKYIKVQQTLQETTDKLNKTKNKLKEIIQQSEKDKQEYLKKFENQKYIEKCLQMNLKDSKLDSVYIYKQISALQNYMQTLQDIKYISGEVCDLNNFANPIDAINIILSKWNSMYIEIMNNEMHIVNNQENVMKNELSVLDSNQHKYILPPVSGKTIFVANTIFNSKNEVSSTNTYNVINDNELDIKKMNRNTVFSKIEDDLSDNENIASVKLIMRFSNKKSENDLGKKISKNNNIESAVECFDSYNLCNSLSTEMIKVSQQINNVIEINKDFSPIQSASVKEQIHLQNDDLFNTLKPLIKNNETLNKCSQEFMLQNLMHSTNSSKKDYSNKNFNLIIEELQDLKNWLSCETNEVIMSKLRKYYYTIENETQQMEELNEQIVILKEKYNTSLEEKASITKKYRDLEEQCKNLLNTTNMVSIYYVLPIVFALIWLLIEKLL